jgi:hypothetical protein
MRFRSAKQLRSDGCEADAASPVARQSQKIREIQFANRAKKGDELVSAHEERS